MMIVGLSSARQEIVHCVVVTEDRLVVLWLQTTQDWSRCHSSPNIEPLGPTSIRPEAVPVRLVHSAGGL